jgi:hypothetical protein
MSSKIEYIKDGSGQFIGSINGDWIRDRSGRLIARYDRGIDRTRTVEGKFVGFGDQRLRELGRREK